MVWISGTARGVFLPCFPQFHIGKLRNACNTDDDGVSSQNIYASNENSPKLLIAMAYGIKDENGKHLADFEHNGLFINSLKKKNLKPSKEELINEVLRRKAFMNDKSKTKKQRRKSEYLKWLAENVNLSSTNADWTTKKINWLHGVLSSSSFCEKENPNKNINFCGDLWILCLIHAQFDFNDSREAMLLQRTALTREELDGRFNENIARRNAY